MKWIDALRVYNQNKGKWCIPRKGTLDYNQVRNIMSGKGKQKKGKITPQKINVAEAMEQNQKRRGALFTKFEDRMRMLDLARKLKSQREF